VVCTTICSVERPRSVEAKRKSPDFQIILNMQGKSLSFSYDGHERHFAKQFITPIEVTKISIILKKLIPLYIIMDSRSSGTGETVFIHFKFNLFQKQFLYHVGVSGSATISHAPAYEQNLHH